VGLIFDIHKKLQLFCIVYTRETGKNDFISLAESLKKLIPVLVSDITHYPRKARKNSSRNFVADGEHTFIHSQISLSVI